MRPDTLKGHPDGTLLTALERLPLLSALTAASDG
jgi:hypothetical protein